MKKKIVLSLLVLALAFRRRQQYSPRARDPQLWIVGQPRHTGPHKTSGTLTFQVHKELLRHADQADPKGQPGSRPGGELDGFGGQQDLDLQAEKGVVFHNGQPFTSKDVKATFERIKADETASPKGERVLAYRGDNDSGRLYGGFHPEFSLRSPPGHLASGWGAILPLGLIASGHNFASEPVGTGPFKFEKWVRDNKITMTRNDNYWMRACPSFRRWSSTSSPKERCRCKGSSPAPLRWWSS